MNKSSKQLLNEYMRSGGRSVRYEDVVRQSRKERRKDKVRHFLNTYGYFLGSIISMGFYLIYFMDWLNEESI